jgi:DNA-binding MarR family transcriptional regulator
MSRGKLGKDNLNDKVKDKVRDKVQDNLKDNQETEPYLIGALLGIIAQTLYRRIDQRLAAAGYPDYRPAHRPVFQYLSRDGSRITELAERAQITKQSMGELVRALEERGYVERVPDSSDGRAVLIRRTERGWALNRTLRRLVQELQDEWANALGEEEMEQLLHLLRQLAGLVGDASLISVSGDPRPARSKQEEVQ